MSQHKQPKSVEGIVTSDAVRGKRHIPHKVRLIALIVGIVVLLGVAGVLYKYVYSSTPGKTVSNKQTSEQNEYLIHPEKAVTAAQSALDQANTSQQKATAYNNLGQAYLNNSQPTEAITAYNNSLSADSAQSNKLTALNGLAYAYDEAGQANKAISTFQQLISIAQASNDSSVQAGISYYQSAIQEIQQGDTL